MNQEEILEEAIREAKPKAALHLHSAYDLGRAEGTSDGENKGRSLESAIDSCVAGIIETVLPLLRKMVSEDILDDVDRSEGLYGYDFGFEQGKEAAARLVRTGHPC